jgi:hypothetical protein
LARRRIQKGGEDGKKWLFEEGGDCSFDVVGQRVHLNLSGSFERPRPRRLIAMKTKDRLMHLIFLILFLLLSMLSGCASVAVSLLGAGTGFGLPYAVNDDADRTLNLPFHQVEKEIPQVLEKMDISMTGYRMF